MKILILGGYGTFGGRLAYLLADDANLTLVIAGRSRRKAEEFCRGLPGAAAKIPLAFDREADVAARLREIEPDLVVDASGPFQSYGADPYRVVQACLAGGIDYLDLADGSEFVNGIGRFDQGAKERNVFILSGVSSFPVLTAAVVRRLSDGMASIESIRAGIAPSPYAGVGRNVLRAIAGYAGKPLALVRGGRPSSGYALTETMRYTIAPPGRLPLPDTLFSLVDVPDLLVLPRLWPEVDTVWMGAGPVPEVLHRMLIGLAWLVRWRLLPTLLPLAGLFHTVINVLRWGKHRGGMFVTVRGAHADGSPVERSWHLLAEGNDGPFIPSMAAEAVIRHAQAGRRPPAGARAATHDVELEDYEALFRGRTIYTGRRETGPAADAAPLYRRLLGSAWDALPAPLQEMHDLTRHRMAEGCARVERGGSPLARLAAALFGFPKAGEDIPLQVSFRVQDGVETWTRTFAGKSFSSVQREGRGAAKHLLSERFGPFTFDMGLAFDSGRLSLIPQRWSLAGLPLPLVLAPRTGSYEHASGGRFNFHVEIDHPLTGLIVRYQGWLVPCD